MNVDKIFERATIRGVADYLLFGLGPDEDDRSYEERLDEIYMRFEKTVGKYDENPTSELLDLCNELSSETASVYGNRAAGGHTADDGYDREYESRERKQRLRWNDKWEHATDACTCSHIRKNYISESSSLISAKVLSHIVSSITWRHSSVCFLISLPQK